MKKGIVSAILFSLFLNICSIHPVYASVGGIDIEDYGTDTYKPGTENEKEEKNNTSYSYKNFATQEEYEKELNKKMSRVYEVFQGNMQVDNICPIPGIIITSYKNNDKSKSSTYYTPQGLCETEDYILVTAFHNSKIKGKFVEKYSGWHSVLYVIDRNTLDFIATIRLPQSYHNGGISYDGQNLWFCGNTNQNYLKDNQPFVQSMKYEKLKEIVKTSGFTGEIQKEDFSEAMYIDNVPSFLECDNGILWVGTYLNNDPASDEGYAIGYPIQDIFGQQPSLNKFNIYRVNGIPSSSQGMDIDGNYLYVSSSGHGNENWIESSFVTKYDISSLQENYYIDLQGKYLKRQEVPKMNEEIIVTDKSIYMIFEASSEAYLQGMPKGMKTDRILAVNKEIWEQENE